MSSCKRNPSKTYKWKVLHIDDEESSAIYFKSKQDAIYHIQLVSGYMLSEAKE